MCIRDRDTVRRKREMPRPNQEAADHGAHRPPLVSGRAPQQTGPEQTGRTAFVLSGGGSLGAVQVGMLKALTESGIQPGILIGASVAPSTQRGSPAVLAMTALGSSPRSGLHSAGRMRSVPGTARAG